MLSQVHLAMGWISQKMFSHWFPLLNIFKRINEKLSLKYRFYDKRDDQKYHCSLQLPEEKKGGEGDAEDLLFMISGDGSKLYHKRSRLDIRKHCFTNRVVKHWGRFPREDSIPQASQP